MKKISFKKLNKFVFPLSIFLIFIIPRIIGIGWDEWNVDAQRWMIRSDLFIRNLLRGDLKGTYQMYHPGVTLMWLSGIAKWIYYTLFELKWGYTPKLSSGTVYPEQFFMVAFFAKASLVIPISILLTYSTLIISKIIKNRKYIFIFALLLSIEPFFLGVNRFFHLTGLESSFVFATFVSFYYYQFVKKKFIFLVLTGAFIGLGFLTKVSAIIVVPFLFLMLIVRLYINKNDLKKEILHAIKDTSILSFIAIAIIFIIFPAMWVDAITTINKIFTTGIEDRAFVDAPHGTILGHKFTYYYEVLFVKSAGLTIISFFISIFVIVKNKIYKKYPILLFSALYFVYYCSVMSIPSKEMTRYSSVVYPYILMVSSYGIFLFFNNPRIKQYIKILAIVLLTTYYSLITYVIYPNFSSFHSELIGGYTGYSNFRKPYNDGEHYLQVGQYINKIGGKDAYEYALITGEANKDISVKLGFLGQTYSGDIPSDVKAKKRFKKIYHVTDYNDVEDFPNCPIIKKFGHRWPDRFDFIYLFECEGN